MNARTSAAWIGAASQVRLRGREIGAVVGPGYAVDERGRAPPERRLRRAALRTRAAGFVACQEIPLVAVRHAREPVTFHVRSTLRSSSNRRTNRRNPPAFASSIPSPRARCNA